MKLLRGFFLATAVMGGGMGAVGAQGPAPQSLSLPQAVDLGLKNNPTVQAAVAARLRMASAVRLQVHEAFLNLNAARQRVEVSREVPH